jgi:hypothetical protein
MRRFPIFCCLIVGLTSFVGCGGVADRPALIPVSGSVLLGGKPVEGATVNFMAPKAPRTASGVTDKDGKFTLSMFEPGDGTMAGENIITVLKIDPASMPAAPASNIPSNDPMALANMASQQQNKKDSGPKYLVPQRYSDEKTTPLKENISPGQQPIVLQLTEG